MSINAQRRRRSRAAKFQVIANLRNVIQHVLEIAGHGDFFHRISKLAVLNPQAAHAARKIAGNHIHAKAEKLEHIKPLLDVANNLLRRAITFLQIEISRCRSPAFPPVRAKRCR